MKTLVAAFILLSSAGAAQAATIVPASDPESALIDIPKSMEVVNAIEQASPQYEGAYTGMPPERFNHPFPGTVRIIWHHPWNIGQACRYSVHTEIACQLPEQTTATVCTIVLPAITIDTAAMEIAVERLQELFVHERAHCEGWDAKHHRD